MPREWRVVFIRENQKFRKGTFACYDSRKEGIARINHEEALELARRSYGMCPMVLESRPFGGGKNDWKEESLKEALV